MCHLGSSGLTPGYACSGEAKTAEAAAKYQKDVQHNLAKFTLVDEEERNLFDFDGENYRDKRKDG